MRDWLLVLAGNLALFAWALGRELGRNRQRLRERVMEVVREWDEVERELGSAFCGVAFEARRLRVTGTASWRRADGTRLEIETSVGG